MYSVSSDHGRAVMRSFSIVIVAGAILTSAATPAFAGRQVSYFATPQWTAGLGAEIKTFDGQDSVVSPTAASPGRTETSQSLEGANAWAEVATLATPYPALSAYATASLSGDSAESSHAGAAATLSYSFEISGQDGDVSATISARGSASDGAAGSAIGGGIAYLQIYSGSDVLVNDYACAGSGEYACAPDESSAIFLNQSFSLVANQYYTIYMSIAADADATEAYASSSSEASASAYLDPYIVIDPSYASDYSLYVTPGIGNAAAAPEPAAWALLLLGVGVLGADLRTRRSGSPWELGS
jgi:hypothetical protein